MPPDAVHYTGLLVFVAATHLALIAVTAARHRDLRRRPIVGWIALIGWAGYGIGSALLALKDMG